MTLSYTSVARALASLRGDPTIAAVAPTETVAYRDGLLVDMYLPPRPRGPSVMLVHGGGFALGSRRMKPMRFLAAHLVGANVAVCALDYRLLLRGGNLAASTQDVADAFACWQTRAPDPHAITMVGLSAGGTLALGAAAACAAARVVSCFGLYEVDHLRGPAALVPRLLFGTPDRARWQFAAPHATPTVLIHGSADGMVPVEQARRLAARRASLGHATKLVVYDDAPHGFFNLPHHPAADAAVGEILSHLHG